MQPGDVVIGGVVGQVVESNDPRVAKDDIVEGMLGWQEYAVAPAKSLRKLDPGAAPITTALYVLGAPGLTAYFGLLDICRPQPGETVVVSGRGRRGGIDRGTDRENQAVPLDRAWSAATRRSGSSRANWDSTAG